MSLDDRFNAFKRAKAPDVWNEVVSREPAASSFPSPRQHGRQLVAVLTALALAVGLFAVLTRSFGGEHGLIHLGPQVRSPQGAISVSGTIGGFRCAARFPSRTITPGAKTGVKVTVTNLTGRVLKVYEGGGNGQTASLEERARSGLLLQDTAHMHDGIFGGPALPQPVKPGASYALPVYDAALLWSGPIETTVRCPVASGITLPPVTLVVQAPGPAPSDREAIARAVAATSPHFDTCAPTLPDHVVTGVTSRVKAGVTLTCKAAIIHRSGFDLVVLAAICSPRVAASFDLSSLATQISAYPSLDLSPPWNVAWQTVAVSSTTAVVANGYSLFAGPNSSGGGGGFHPC